jgi:hypothetical protein
LVWLFPRKNLCINFGKKNVLGYISGKIFETSYGHPVGFERSSCDQGCQMEYFQTQKPNFGIYFKGLAVEIFKMA